MEKVNKSVYIWEVYDLGDKNCKVIEDSYLIVCDEEQKIELLVNELKLSGMNAECLPLADLNDSLEPEDVKEGIASFYNNRGFDDRLMQHIINSY